MKFSRNMSLRRKQTLIIMATSLIVLLLACAAFSIYEAITFRTATVQNLATLADIVDDNSAAALSRHDAKSAGEMLSALQAEPGIIGACVYAKSGEVFAKFDSTNDDVQFIPPVRPPAGYAFQAGRLALSRPIEYKGETIGMLYLEADLRTLYPRLIHYAEIVGLVFFISLLIAFGLSSRLQRVLSDPILDLAGVARSVTAEKNYALRASKRTQDELGQLVDCFNEMLAQIQERDAALQAARDHLEKRVQERTAELATANQALTTEMAERVQANQAMLAAQAKYRTIFENSISGIFQTSPEGRYLDVNPALARIYGYDSTEDLMAGVKDIARKLYVDPDRRTEFIRLMREQGVVKDFESEIYRKDGSIIWISENSRAVRKANGEIEYYEGMVEDITDRRRFEARLFQSQKMETVGKLAGGVAHEFNSIMTAIIGQSELMLHDLSSASPLRKNATEIHQAAERAAVLTRQLLAYGRKQILQPGVLDLNAVLAGMDSTLRHLAGRDVDIHIAPPAGPKLVKVDTGQIEQVIVNIVMNAAEAMPRGGKLTLETGEAFLDQDYVRQFADLKAGEYVMLAITDTGTGMSDAVKARCFEPFFTTKEVGKGTGLGLATCHGIIKQSEGHISVYSEIGRGATFKIYLPKARMANTPAAAPIKSPGMPPGTETILLVEDDPALREMSGTLLGRLGYRVLTAANGIEALNITHQPAIGHIDLLFTDVVMPHMSGKELSDRIRSLFPRTKILFTSAYTENAIVHQGVLDPGIILLQKPFTPSGLANKVRQVLDADKTSGLPSPA